MLALIDADSMIYIIAWNHRETVDAADVKDNCDEFIRCILGLVQADKYLGTFSSKENFRHRNYKHALYKGNRPTKAYWLEKWEWIIKNHMIDNWGFIIPEDMEADDVISAMAWYCSMDTIDHVICSPDKDMRQIPGYHFDYKKQELGIIHIDAIEAERHFQLQLITGDTSDNIKGVKDMGGVKAEKFLNALIEDGKEMAIYHDIYSLYAKIHGEYYGTQIYQETYEAVRLLGADHPKYSVYRDQLMGIYNSNISNFDLNNISGRAGADKVENPFNPFVQE